MSLTVQLKNIGIIKQAEFSLGDLTIICGENNTGKTYAAYALYGFLRSWRKFIMIPVEDHHIHSLLSEGTVKIELARTAKQVLVEACRKYTNQLNEIFSVPEGSFQNSEFYLSTDRIDIRDEKIEGETGSNQGAYFKFSKPKGSEELTVTLGIKKEISPDSAKSSMNIIIHQVVFSNAFPNSFISSSERTGAAIFRKELNFARNRLLEEMGRVGQGIVDRRQLLSKAYQNYPWPVQDNMDLMQQLEDVVKRKSFIAKEHPEILADFADITGGEYAITRNDLRYYIPKNTRIKLTMDQSSSSVRSLLDLGFYLSCVAKKGDLLMVDEPELSLHPENQRRIAKFFARLVNLGIKVFITTHSDYIIKELNTLIMLNHDKPHLKAIAKANGYQENELIKAEQVKVYVAEKALMPLEEGQKKRRRAHTLVPADIDPEFGIEVRSFDKTIDTMNKIQRDIVWGAKQDK